NLQLTGARASSSDQFTFNINATSGGATLASGTSSGTGNGPFTAATLTTASALPLTLTQTMAAGSVNPLTDYQSSLSCTNSVGSTTPMPNGVITTNYSFGALQFGDLVTCTFTNTVFPHLQLTKALGSGGLWNNSKGTAGKDPLVKADKPLGEWNTFRIVQVGARTTIHLNGKLVVKNAILENFWDRKSPLPRAGKVLLQTHGGEIRWRNIFVKELSPAEALKALSSSADETGFTPIFNGKDFKGWKGAVDNYEVVDGAIRCKAGKGGALHTEKEFSDFVVRVEYKLPPGGNNGLAIRYPGKGDPAYSGMCELQILDDTAEKYSKLDPRQYNLSSYGMVAVKRGYLFPVGEWNMAEVTVKGSTIVAELNGSRVLDADLSTVKEYMANSPHPGKEFTKGFFGFAGHGDAVSFRNVRIKEIAAK
ncbi:MAG: DUF1080 domain-containing protein, partial [Planctomycetes bacterium]|nr:DUF1080 domain-containing protein [Planctomycetota bacterium]